MRYRQGMDLVTVFWVALAGGTHPTFPTTFAGLCLGYRRMQA
jgi:hypothetical protein